MNKKYKCPLCYGEHEIDEYGYIDSCVGYIDIEDMIDKIENHVIDLQTKNNTRSKRNE